MITAPAFFLGLALWAPVLDERADANALYRDCGLAGQLDGRVFAEAITRAQRLGELPGIIAIADMSQPSTAQRFYLVDLRNRKLLLRSWVAHGKGSGEERCERVSNRTGSLCTCAGIMRVGERIQSPKHGGAILLHGLEKGVNDRAESREIIIHGADYVSAEQIRAHGRLGRSWGCRRIS